MFRTNIPVTAEAFFDRAEELAILGQAIDSLTTNVGPRWYAILGTRKIGKTSLLLELERCKRSNQLVFSILDSYEDLPVSLAIFRRYALRVVDAFFARKVGVSLESLAARPDDYRAALFDCDDFVRLSRDLRTTILGLVATRFDRAYVEMALRLPQNLAQQLACRCVVAWDEFQELAELSKARTKIDIFALARSIWQRHDLVSYFISGSRRSMIKELVSSPQSPFFQHFSLLDLKPMEISEATLMLQHSAAPRRKIPRPIAVRAAKLFAGHPFYLQLFGETLTRNEPPYTEKEFNSTIGELLFTPTGRLSFFFQREYDQLVGKASTLAAVLNALAEGPQKLNKIATATRSSTGATVRYLERLGDAVVHLPDGRYAVTDPVFALWLGWRKPGGTITPLTVIGNEAELTVARALAEMGFELIYQSRASRGSFDLLAVRGGIQIGVQVKGSPLPVRFNKREWNRMNADAARYGWRFTIASVSADGANVYFLAPEAARISRAVTLDKPTIIDNLLDWLDSPLAR